MIHRVVGSIIAAAFVWAAVPALACHTSPTCTAGTILTSVNTYICDRQCNTATDCAQSISFSNCDVCGTTGDPDTPDGKCVICNVGGHAATMTGSGGADVVCGGALADVISTAGGADIINAGDGNDSVSGGGGQDEIDGGPGSDSLNGEGENDTIIDGAGNNYLDGGTGADTLWTGTGDDELHGGTGNDLLIGGGGADYLDGGADNDTLSALVYGNNVAPDDVLGSRYCGGPGNDNLQARGAGHQCMEGGDGTDTCGYAFWVTGRSPGPFDVGTATDCESSPGVTSTRHPACACP